MKNILSLCCFFLLVGCINSNKKALTEIVNEWSNKEIIFPKNSHFVTNMLDTVSMSMSKYDYRIICYVDSIGCLSCKFKTNLWKQYISELDSVMKGRVQVLFYINPSNQKDLDRLIKQNDFKYPICIDTADSLNKLNRFPSQLLLQTFLLDSNNRVKIIGNPILNKHIKQLYIETMLSKY